MGPDGYISLPTVLHTHTQCYSHMERSLHCSPCRSRALLLGNSMGAMPPKKFGASTPTAPMLPPPMPHNGHLFAGIIVSHYTIALVIKE